MVVVNEDDEFLRDVDSLREYILEVCLGPFVAIVQFISDSKSYNCC